MITAKLDKDSGILHVQPSGPLEAGDFERLAALADPYIAKKGELAGLMIEVERFPGWKNLAGMLTHFRFVRNHHRKIRRVALLIDARGFPWNGSSTLHTACWACLRSSGPHWPSSWSSRCGTR